VGKISINVCERRREILLMNCKTTSLVREVVLHIFLSVDLDPAKDYYKLYNSCNRETRHCEIREFIPIYAPYREAHSSFVIALKISLACLDCDGLDLNSIYCAMDIDDATN